MKLYKKNRGTIILEFVIVLPLFLIVVSIINDVSNYVRIKGTIEELTSSIVSVPFHLISANDVISGNKMKRMLRVAARAFVVSYKLYTKGRNPNLIFCWTAVDRKGVLWKVWMEDKDGSLIFAKTSIGQDITTYEDYSSTITPAQYSGAIGSGSGKVLVLEVFLTIKDSIQFLNFFKMFDMNAVHVRAFGVPKSQGQIPNVIESENDGGNNNDGGIDINPNPDGKK